MFGFARFLFNADLSFSCLLSFHFFPSFILIDGYELYCLIYLALVILQNPMWILLLYTLKEIFLLFSVFSSSELSNSLNASLLPKSDSLLKIHLIESTASGDVFKKIQQNISSYTFVYLYIIIQHAFSKSSGFGIPIK